MQASFDYKPDEITKKLYKPRITIEEMRVLLVERLPNRHKE